MESESLPREPLGRRRGRRRRVSCAAGEPGSESRPTKLAALVKRKHEEVSALLSELGEEVVEERMQSA
eukprot:scaffold453314_cov36-Prasinocladus_malaysianus.AAC.1